MSDLAGKALTSSQEDYLEAILYLVRQSRVARVRDIAQRLGVGKPSVTSALKALSRRKLVNYDPYQYITLTDLGRELAEEISHRHVVLRRFLMDVLGIDADTADANACRMEHAIDPEVLGRLKALASFLQECPRTGPDWIDAFQNGCTTDRGAARCEACLQHTVARHDSEEEPA